LRPAQDNRLYFEGMMWIARTGSQWRHLPDEYGKWNSVFRRYRRWVSTGVFDAMLETLTEMVERDVTADMIDSTVVRAHHCAVGIKRGLRKPRLLGRSRGGFSTKLHARCDAKGRPLGLVLTPGQSHDIQGFGPLFRMIADKIEALLADKVCDADAIREELTKADVEAVIPAKSNRREPIAHDRENDAGATSSSACSTSSRTGGARNTIRQNQGILPRLCQSRVSPAVDTLLSTKPSFVR
jgi:transposase